MTLYISSVLVGFSSDVKTFLKRKTSAIALPGAANICSVNSILSFPSEVTSTSLKTPLSSGFLKRINALIINLST